MSFALSEEHFLAAVLSVAHLHRWHAAHFRPARTEHGFRTSVQGDAKGFPDLVLVRERLVFAELKSESGILSPAQAVWARWLDEAHAEYYVWRPDDLATIEVILR